eukprot:COSAG01_NODE_1418_length_10375_cov_38.842254_10_plen_128_part_00
MTIHRHGLLGLHCVRHARTHAAVAAATATAVLCGGATAVHLLQQQPGVAACQPQKQQPAAPPQHQQNPYEPSAPDAMRTQSEGSWRLNLGRTRCTAIARLPARLRPHAGGKPETPFSRVPLVQVVPW